MGTSIEPPTGARGPRHPRDPFDDAALALELLPAYADVLETKWRDCPLLDRSGYDTDEWVPRWHADPALLAIEGLTLLTTGWSLAVSLPPERHRIQGENEGKVRKTAAFQLVQVPFVANLLQEGGVVLPPLMPPADESVAIDIRRAALDRYIADLVGALRPAWSYWLRRWLHPSASPDCVGLRRAVLRQVWGDWLKRVGGRVWRKLEPLSAMLGAAHGVARSGKGDPTERVQAQWATLLRLHGGSPDAAAAELLQEAWRCRADVFRATQDGGVMFDGSVLLNMLDHLVPRRRAKGNVDPASTLASGDTANVLEDSADLHDAVEQARHARIRETLERYAREHGPGALALLEYEAGLGTKEECAARFGTSRGALDHAKKSWFPGALRRAVAECDL